MARFETLISKLELKLWDIDIQAVFLNWDAVEFLISMSHIHKGRHTDKRTYYMPSEF